MSRSDPRKTSFGVKVSVPLFCGHGVFFRSKVKPKPGEIIWCSLCGDYKEVKRDP